MVRNYLTTRKQYIQINDSEKANLVKCDVNTRTSDLY